MTPPLVSVLIPTYKYARYLAETIESVLEQDYPNFEVLVSDDCSGDGSAEIILRYAARDPRIRAQIHGSNLGMVENWNWCLREARGEYVKFVFGDDKLASPQALSKLARLLETNPSVTLAVSARNLIDEHSQVIDVWDYLGKSGFQNGREVIARCLNHDRNLIGEPSVVMFRKRDATRGFHPEYRQLPDLEMWYHLLEKADLAYTKELLCSFRQHDQQQSRLNQPQYIGETEAVRLFFEYRSKVPLRCLKPKGQLFLRAYNARKPRNRNLALRAELPRIMAELGRFWYALYWVRRKLTQPFLNLRHSVHKRLRSARLRRGGLTSFG